MKKVTKKLCLIICFFMLGFLPSIANAGGTLVFCKSLDAKLNPSGIASKFETNVVSWVAKSDEAFNAHHVVLSFYQRDGMQERLLHRVDVPINPYWNLLAMEDVPFPSEGIFVVALTKENGETIAMGAVEISKAKPVKKDIKEKKEVKGKTLEQLFDQYKPKK